MANTQSRRLVRSERISHDHFHRRFDQNQTMTWGWMRMGKPGDTRRFDLGDLTIDTRQVRMGRVAVLFARAVSLNVKCTDGAPIGYLGLWVPVGSRNNEPKVGWEVGDTGSVIPIHLELESEGTVNVGRRLASEYRLNLHGTVSSDHATVAAIEPQEFGVGVCQVTVADVSRHGTFYTAPSNYYNGSSVDY